MEYNSTLRFQDILEGKLDLIDFNWRRSSQSARGKFSINKVFSPDKENFMQYLRRLNLNRESDVLVLPSDNHYFYDESELKSVKTLINLRTLNQIKHPARFLQTLFNILPADAKFIGCFSDDKRSKNSGGKFYKPSRLMNRFINFIDSKVDHILDKMEVSELLELHGFKIVDMTEIDGTTYFYSQNIRSRIKQRA